MHCNFLSTLHMSTRVAIKYSSMHNTIKGVFNIVAEYNTNNKYSY